MKFQAVDLNIKDFDVNKSRKASI